MKLQGLKWPSTGKLLDKCDDGGEIRFYEDRKEVNEYLERDTTVKVDIVMQLGIKFAVASLMEHLRRDEDSEEDEDSVKVISDISTETSDIENYAVSVGHVDVN